MIAAGGKDKVAIIFKRVNGEYMVSQRIWTGFNIFEVFITHQSLAVAGHSNKILFFTHNGSEFVREQTLVTNETKIQDIGLTDDFEKITFGRTNQTLNIFTRVNSTYQKQFSFDLGVEIRSARMDEGGLYYHAITMDQRMYTFYQCPA